MLDVYYLNGRRMTEQEEDALALSFCDYDDNGEYVSVEPQEVLNGYAALFANVVTILEGKFNLPEGETPKPCYKDASGKPIVVWMKLLRHKKRKGDWINITPNGELGFDNFVGSGILEIYNPKTNVPAKLRIDLSKESILPQETKKTPSVGGVAPMGGTMVPSMAAMPMDDGGAYSAAGEEMPF